MMAELVGAILSGLAGLVTASAGIFALLHRQREDGDAQEIKELLHLRKDNSELRQASVIAERHIYRLELLLARTDIRVPNRPSAIGDTGVIPIQNREDN